MPTHDWTPLRAALRACRAAGIPLALWWRDDDAIAPSAPLDRLIALSETAQVPVHLAIIPKMATPALVACCADRGLIPVVHGWAHRNYSKGADKKNEFLTPRPDAISDAERGLRRMQHLFGDALRPMFVPPWNRVSDQVVAQLGALGFTGLSTYGARQAVQAAPGVMQINTHVDPIDWKGSRSVVDPDTLIAQAAAHLNARVEGVEDAAEPFGLLTHHLVHDPVIWSFSAAFLQEMQDGGATPWTMETDNEPT